jgi:hypothetical protein
MLLVHKNRKEIDQLLSQLIQGSLVDDKKRRETDEDFRFMGAEGWYTFHLKTLKELIDDDA